MNLTRTQPLNRNPSLMDWDICQDLSSTKSRKKWICRGAIEDLLTTKTPWWIEKLSMIYWPNRKFLDKSKNPWWIKKLSRIYRPDKKFLAGSKKLTSIYQEEIQKSRWIEIAIRSIEKRRKKGLIEGNLSRFCREVVELEENEFFKEGKNIKRLMQHVSYLNTDPINMLSS